MTNILEFKYCLGGRDQIKHPQNVLQGYMLLNGQDISL